MSLSTPRSEMLRGYTVGVTADRRSDEQISLLTGRGAQCLHGPTVRTHPLRPEQEIVEATTELLTEQPDFVLFTTGIGVRGWLEAADALLLGEDLRAVLGRSRLLARGPKAHGAAITAGLEVEWNAPSATTAEVIDKLRALAEPGDRVAIQVDGDPHRSPADLLTEDGFDVVTIPVYRWSVPEDTGPAEALIRATIERRVDLVTFTARPAAENLRKIAVVMNSLDQLRDAFAGDVKSVCIGSVCAEGMAGLCDDPIIPDRFRLGAMITTITSELQKSDIRFRLMDRDVVLRGSLVVVGGQELEAISVRERQVLRALIAAEGRVLSKADLLKTVWRGTESDTHVVEVTVGRLRRRLGPVGAGIETVFRRGYRVSAT